MTEDRCPCHGKTEAELAAPYALASYGLAILAVLVLVVTVVVA